MASNSILFISFILFILSNSLRLSYTLSEPHNHTPQFGQNSSTDRFGARITRIPTTMSVDTRTADALRSLDVAPKEW